MENYRAWRGGISSVDGPLMGNVEQHLVAFGDLSVTLRSRVSVKLWKLNYGGWTGSSFVSIVIGYSWTQGDQEYGNKASVFPGMCSL